MPYATITDLQQRYGDAELRQLSDIGTPRLGVLVPEVLQRALEDASAWIDGYLAGRYSLPITDATALGTLRLHCCAEARFLLMTKSADQVAVDAHAERARFFASIAKGDIALIQPASVPPAVGAGPVVFLPGTKVFGRDELGAGDERGVGL